MSRGGPGVSSSGRIERGGPGLLARVWDVKNPYLCAPSYSMQKMCLPAAPMSAPVELATEPVRIRFILCFTDELAVYVRMDDSLYTCKKIGQY